MEATIRFIGRVHSRLVHLRDCPLLEHEDAPEATIEVLESYKDAMTNIKPGAQLILLSWLHRSDRTVLTTRPRNNPDAPLTGIFSTRSPDRPNPVGIHFVKVISVSGDNQFTVSGLELLDQTPIIDIKPDLSRNA